MNMQGHTHSTHTHRHSRLGLNTFSRHILGISFMASKGDLKVTTEIVTKELGDQLP